MSCGECGNIFECAKNFFFFVLQNIGELDLDAYLNNKEKTSFQNWYGWRKIFFSSSFIGQAY